MDICLISHPNIRRDPSLEPSWEDGSNEESQHMFRWENMEKYLDYPFNRFLSGAPSYETHRNLL